MTARPYAPMNIEQLEELAERNGDDREVLKRLIAELQHRKNRRARQLLSQLEGPGIFEADRSDVSDPSFNRSHSNSPGSITFDQETPVHSNHSPPSPSNVDYESLLRKYENLRTTFTAEAELLAHWGMTPALPRDLQDLVFEEWRKRLPDGRPAEILAEDRTRIYHEREALEDAMKARGISTALFDTDGMPSAGGTQ